MPRRVPLCWKFTCTGQYIRQCACGRCLKRQPHLILAHIAASLRYTCEDSQRLHQRYEKQALALVTLLEPYFYFQTGGLQDYPSRNQSALSVKCARHTTLGRDPVTDNASRNRPQLSSIGSFSNGVMNLDRLQKFTVGFASLLLMKVAMLLCIPVSPLILCLRESFVNHPTRHPIHLAAH